MEGAYLAYAGTWKKTIFEIESYAYQDNHWLPFK